MGQTPGAFGPYTPGRAELKNLGRPSFLLGALERSAPALVGAKALNVSHMTHLSGLNHMPITSN